MKFSTRTAVLAVSTFGFAFLSAFAHAADLASPATSSWDQRPSLWRGAYWSAGLGLGESGVDISGVGKKDSGDLDEGSARLFAALGYNFTYGNFVYGLEADIGDLGLDRRKDIAGLGTIDARAGFSGSLRGRAGYAFDNVLVYGTAGLAMTHLKVSSSLGGKDDTTDFGLVAGLGAEVALDENWRLRGEGLIYGFHDPDVMLAGAKHDVDTAHAEIRIGVGRKF